MMNESAMLVCPKGHTSTEADYCSECGAKMAGAAGASAPAAGSVTISGSTQICPDCGTSREQNDIAFCEVCGYNFTTGAHGELDTPGTLAGVAAAAAEVAETEHVQNAAPSEADERSERNGRQIRWAVVVSVDPTLRGPESPEPPSGFVPCTVVLDRPVNLIGRTHEARAIFPEIALPLDEAVSRRHALLQQDDAGALSVRDIGSANGTRLNGRELAAMTDAPLKAGDEITLGHWSRLTVQAGT